MMWLGPASATASLVAILSAVATIGSFLAYLYFVQRSNANAARDEALALAETRREVIDDLRASFASSEERHKQFEADAEKRIRELEATLDDTRREARDQAYQMQRLYATGLAGVLEGVRSDLEAIPPDVDRARSRIRDLLASTQPALS
jgi:hypothetical protein